MPDYLFWIGEAAAAGGVLALTIVQILRYRGDQEYLCGDCRFNSPELCLKSERPKALDCTGYRPRQGEAGVGYNQ
jgi:hypothetical protein